MDQQTTPRGLRNNNPLNIRKSNQEWRHKIVPGSDKVFEQFDRIEWGIRAAFVILRTYLSRRVGLKTLPQIIARFAPASENNTEKYIAYVSNRAVIPLTEKIEIKNKNQVCRLLWAMSQYENGVETPFHVFEYAYELMKQDKK